MWEEFLKNGHVNEPQDPKFYYLITRKPLSSLFNFKIISLSHFTKFMNNPLILFLNHAINLIKEKIL